MKSYGGTSAILLPLILFILSCSNIQIQSPSPENRVVLAAASTVCKPEASKSQWYLLFGAFPLNRVEIPFADPHKTYRLTEESRLTDKLITIVGAVLLSVTRRTIYIEACEETFELASPEQQAENRKKENQEALDQYMVKDAAGRPGEPIFIMNSGESHRGKIEEISATQIIIQERKKADKVTDPEQAKRMATIYLKTGAVLSGEITDQTTTSLTLLTGGQTKILPKNQIKRIAYMDARKRDEWVMDRVILEKADIKRIVLAEPPKIP